MSRLVVAAKHSELRRVSEWVRAFARELALTRHAAHGLELAIEEALTNIMSYGFTEGGPHQISIELTAGPQRIRVELEDDGLPFNPLDSPQPAAPEALEQSRPTGRGIAIMRAFMDALEYVRRDDRNVLTMELAL